MLFLVADTDDSFASISDVPGTHFFLVKLIDEYTELIKLIAELHEVYGAAVPGNPRTKAQAYLIAWTERRGIDPLFDAEDFDLDAPPFVRLRHRTRDEREGRQAGAEHLGGDQGTHLVHQPGREEGGRQGRPALQQQGVQAQVAQGAQGAG